MNPQDELYSRKQFQSNIQNLVLKTLLDGNFDYSKKNWKDSLKVQKLVIYQYQTKVHRGDFLKKELRLGAQSVTLLSTLRDPTQLRGHLCAFRKQPLFFVPM